MQTNWQHYKEVLDALIALDVMITRLEGRRELPDMQDVAGQDLARYLKARRNSVLEMLDDDLGGECESSDDVDSGRDDSEVADVSDKRSNH
jgi:hypothetical protein